MWKRFTSLFALLSAVLLVAAACSSSDAIDEDVPAVGEGDAGSGDVVRVVEIDMTEFAFGADSFEFTPGETVEFVITNSGVAEHELRISNQDRVDAHVAGGHADHSDGAEDGDEAAHDDDEAAHDDDEAAHDDDEAAHDDDEAAHDDDEAAHDDDEAAHDDDEAGAQDVVLVIGAGETGTLVFTFPDNDHDYTAIVCLIPGHYEAGMSADLSYDA